MSRIERKTVAPKDTAFGGTQQPSLASGSGLPWLLGLRFSILGISLVSVLASLAVLDGSSAALAERLLWPLLLFLAVSATSWWWARQHGWSRRFAHLQIAFDVILVTGIVYVTGGALSPFLFLFLPVVMVSSLLGTRTTAIVTAAGCTLSYLGLLLTMKLGWLLSFHGGAYPETPSSGLALQSFGLASAMVLIAFATSYLVQSITKRDVLVEQSRKDLQEISEKQQLLLESLPESMCVVDAKGRISTANRAALSLLSDSSRELRGRSFEEVIRDRDAKASFLKTEAGYSGELSVPELGEQAERRMRYTARSLPEGDGHVVMFQDITALRSVEEQLELQDRMARLLASASELPQPPTRRLGEFVGESVVMQKVFALISRVARSDATILVHGESGTGKELVAKGIHQESPRCTGPFVAVNCGAIPETLLESEFFGHKRGAFTSAHADHMGLFQRASGGTLFLDEIGELPSLMQAKLLRAIQEKSIRPVGGDRDQAVDVRIIAATNRNLKKEIEVGNFREDLYYRLNVISISLPPLRDRRDDIPLLVNSILQRLIAQRRSSASQSAFGEKVSLLAESPTAIPPQTMQYLVSYSYPGNVRELENIIERAFVLGGSVILPEHLPDAVTAGNYNSDEPGASGEGTKTTQIIIDESIEFPVNLETILETLERRYIEEALEKSGGIKKRAAELLGINFRSLRYRLQKFGLHDEHDG